MNAVGMSARRLWLAQAVILFILGASLTCIALDTEYWPFSQYEVYSQLVRPGPSSELFVFGIVDGGEEIPMRGGGKIRPFDWERLRLALMRIVAQPNHDARLREALQDLLVRYNARQARRRAPVPFRAVRLYRFWWDDVTPRAPRTAERASRRELLVEVTAAGAGGA